MSAIVVTVVLLAVACGAPPTAQEGAETEGATGEGAATEGEGEPTEAATGDCSAMDDVYAEVEGMTGDERQQALVELAGEEPALNIYSSTNIEDAQPLLEAYEEETGIEPSYYRASASDVLERILQESDAGVAGNDVVQVNGTEMAILADRGMLTPLNSPYTEDILDVAVYDTWAGVYVNSFVAGWNTNAISADEAPASWEEVLTNYEGRLAMELGDFDWFATLVNQHFTKELGMSEEEAVDLFKQAASGAQPVDGHTLMAELLVAGEYDVASSLYQHRVAQLSTEEDAPLAWNEPAPVEPVVIRPNGNGIMCSTQAPASSLLWAEFMFTTAQDIFSENFRGPASTQVSGGLPEDTETLVVDFEELLNNRDKWSGLYEEVIREAGG